MSRQSQLLNGSTYIEYKPQKDEHPYFLPEWYSGSIVYDGEQFDNVALLYDLNADVLVTENIYGANKIQLVSEKVDRFIIEKHLFVLLTGQKIENGFYEL